MYVILDLEFDASTSTINYPGKRPDSEFFFKKSLEMCFFPNGLNLRYAQRFMGKFQTDFIFLQIHADVHVQ